MMTEKAYNLLSSSFTPDLRFLVTQNCNYGCLFCHKEGLQSDKSSELLPADYGFFFKVGKDYFNFTSATLTGGEPLFRKDITKIAAAIHNEGGSLALTTNGSLLAKRANIGSYLEKLNISVHSLNPDKYDYVVGHTQSFKKFKTGLAKFRSRYPDLKIVFNATLVEGFNSDREDFMQYIRFAEQLRASIKFIELFTTKPGGMPLEGARRQLLELGFHETAPSRRKINLSNKLVDVSLTRILCSQAAKSSTPGIYCKQNNDLFISPDGTIKPCREDIREIDMYSAIKERDSASLREKVQVSIDLLGDNCKYQ